MHKTINLVFGSDRNNVLGLAVAAKTVLDTVSRICNIYVLNVGISSKDQEKLRNSWRSDKLGQLYFIPIDPSMLQCCRPTMYLRTKSPYVRYLLGEVIPESIERCMWLDTDLLVKSDLAEVYYQDLERNTIGAITDVSVGRRFDKDVKKRMRKLGILNSDRYFNSGVLLIDLSRWRDQGIGKKLFDHANQYYEILDAQDQDGLNGVLHHQWLPLDPVWNQSQYKSNLNPSKGIIHLIGKKKPWHADYNYRFKEDFFQALNSTDFQGEKPWNPLGIGVILKQIERKIPSAEILYRKILRLLK